MKLQLEVRSMCTFSLYSYIVAQENYRNDHSRKCSTRKQICYTSVARIVCTSRICQCFNYQHAQCTCTMMFGLSEILKRDWRGKSQGQNCGMVFLKSIYGVRVFCQWLYIYLIYSFIQCELFCRCIHFLLWGVTVLQAKRPHLLVVMPAFLCVKQLGVRSLIYHNLSIRIISNLSH